ncbi:MAG: hypothetical protein OXT09_03525 [Myxococcales bacterium]|nr:hypothetical protein [Myxococcales bacterium]
MSRWLLLSCCVLVLAALAYAEPTRSPTASGLGGSCATDRDCQLGLECAYVAGVIEAQCTASCNATPACQERFGTQSLCLGADLCTRTCEQDTDCPSDTACNTYGWCEGL